MLEDALAAFIETLTRIAVGLVIICGIVVAGICGSVFLTRILAAVLR